MILQELYNFAMRERLVPDPDFEAKPVPWLVYINRDGRLLNIAGTHYKVQIETKTKAKDPAKAKPKFRQMIKQFPIPRDGGRSSGDRAFFFCDKAEYVFGVSPDDKSSISPEKLQNRRELFRERVRLCAEETQDEAAKALLMFLDNAANGDETIDLASLSVKVAANDLFAFVYGPDGDILMTDREKIKNYWKNLRSPNDCVSGQAVRQCLVTGKDCGNIELFPMIKKMPGGTTSGASLVSFNKKAFESYGWRSNENAPICRDAAEACATALNRLVDWAPINPNNPSETLPRQNVMLSADTVACYWNRGGSEFCGEIDDLFGSDPEKVGELYRCIWKGKMPSVPDEEYDAFYALTLSGAQGRVILRDWFESTIRKVQENLCQYFRDIDISRRRRFEDGAAAPQGLGFMLESVADPAKNRSETIPGYLASALFNAALTGRMYPETILTRAVARYRAEIGKCNDEQERWITRDRNDARAALIKAVLNRKKRHDAENKIHYSEVFKLMDPNNKNPGYLLGRLMAVMEKLQVEALQKELDLEGNDGEESHPSSGERKKTPNFVNINRTIVDRFFSGASATPKAVFPRLLCNAKHHEKKLAEKDRGRAVMYVKYIDDTLSHFNVNRKSNQLHRFSEGFPQYLNLNDQGLFVIGYHHMRHWLWMRMDEREAWEREYAEEYHEDIIPDAYRRQSKEDKAADNSAE